MRDGNFYCFGCGEQMTVANPAATQTCPACGHVVAATEFRLLFERERRLRHEELIAALHLMASQPTIHRRLVDPASGEPFITDSITGLPVETDASLIRRIEQLREQGPRGLHGL